MSPAVRPLAWLLVVYLALSAVTLAVWDSRDTYRVNGDEPWYLLIASGVSRFGTLEQSRPHAAEITERRIAQALPAFDADHPGATHMVAGPRGNYSVHNLGLPLVISPGFALAGVMGARLTLMLAGVWVLVSVWRIAGLSTVMPAMRVAITAGVALALPVLGGAGQIYPDILAGAICLHLLVTLACRPPVAAAGWSTGLLLALLPWLQIRYAAPAGVLCLALLWGLRGIARGTRIRAGVRLLLPGFVAALLLGTYHLWAFGNLGGPYGAGALRPGLTALAVFAGLHIDQNQGLLVQNPALLLGVAGLGTLLATRPRLGLAVVLTYLALIVPNALHPNWYGGWSFSGRFGWSAALVLMLPAAIGLGRIARARPRLALGLAAAALLVQATAYVGYTVGLGADAWYNRALAYLPTPSLSAYGLLGGAAWPWLPTVYGGADDASWRWIWRHLPNGVAILTVLALLLVGWHRRRATDAAFTRGLGVVAVFGACLLVLAGWGPRADGAPAPGHEFGRTWSACPPGTEPARDCIGALRGTTGHVQDGVRLAQATRDAPGLLVFGALQWLERGPYRLTLDYTASAPPDVTAGQLRLVPIEGVAPLVELALPGSAGQRQSLTANITARDALRVYETVVQWHGQADLVLHALRISRQPSRTGATFPH